MPCRSSVLVVVGDHAERALLRTFTSVVVSADLVSSVGVLMVGPLTLRHT